MSELYFLKLWVEKIQKEKSWSHYSEWTNHEYQMLSDEINEKVKILISRNTIRKIIENIHTPSGYSPYIATKNALAQFVGFKSWYAFKQSYSEPESKNNNKKKVLTTFAIASLFVISLLVVYYISNTNQASSVTDSFLFEIENPSGTIPHTVIANFDISELKTDNVKIDFGHVNAEGIYMLSALNKDNNNVKNCIHTPGSYYLRLFIDNKVAASEKVWIYSDGWFAYTTGAESYRQKVEVPDFIFDAGAPSLKYIPFKSILDLETTPEGYFHIPTENILNLEEHAVNYHLNLKYFKPFGLDIQNSKFSVRFKDLDFWERVNCSEAGFFIHCDNGNVGFKFAQEGCDRYTVERIGAFSRTGKFNDLSYLILSYEKFRTLSIVSDTNRTDLIIDGQLIKSYDNENDLGEIKGIHMFYKGSPYIDFVRLTDSKNNIVFNEEFDSN